MIAKKRNSANPTAKHEGGFSMIELVVVVAILLIVAGIAVPNILSMMHTSRLRGTASDFSGIVQATRIRAVQDDHFYSAYVLGSYAYVDLYPVSNTGASGNGGTSVDFVHDPVIGISQEVITVAVGSAPATTNLSSQFLPSGSGVTPKDGGAGTGAPITFGPRGLPCTPQTATGGTVCDSAGGPTAFWVFFKNNVTGAFQAVTVSPAGRIRKWFYNGSSWASS